jgi:TonB family protein
MENLDADANEQPSPLGYIAAIVVSALGHVALAVLVFFVLPAYLHSDRSPQVFSVKVVDQIPAGDLGTHLPRLSSRAHHRSAKPKAPKPEEPQLASKLPPPPPPPSDNDKNAIALNTFRSPVPAETATPTPTPEPPPASTPELTPPTPAPTATPKPHKHEAKPRATHRPTPQPTPKQSERRKPKAKPTVMIAEAGRTPSVQEQLNKLRERLLAEHLKAEAASEENASAEPDQKGGGPVVADRATERKGMGVGPGTGSAGIQQDPEFLLYYQTVQARVKKAWSFSGGAGDLTTTVTFAIGPDGGLTAVKITRSSHDAAFDDSVIRAIRRAAPFPPPPEKYRSDFAEGVEAVFKLGELSS